MKVLIAPNNYKESISAEEAALAIEAGLLTADPTVETTRLPLSDGGEGFVKALVNATQGDIIPCKASDPLGRDVTSFYGGISRQTAVIEMALASGLELLKEDEKDPWIATTYGTGVLIGDALDKGFRNIIVGIGGSATNDAGMGMIQALGGKFYSENGEELGHGARFLGRVDHTDLSAFRKKIGSATFTVACDVTNPLLGGSGATRVYGPQKGADQEMLDRLEAGIRHFSGKVNETFGTDYTDHPGAGAAGGMGYALLTFMGARLQPGYDIVAEYTDLEHKVITTDLIITGEGKIDDQTLQGKVISRLGATALSHAKPVVAIGGIIDPSVDLKSAGILRSFSIMDRAADKEDAMQNAGDHLRMIGADVIASL